MTGFVRKNRGMSQGLFEDISWSRNIQKPENEKLFALKQQQGKEKLRVSKNKPQASDKHDPVCWWRGKIFTFPYRYE